MKSLLKRNLPWKNWPPVIQLGDTKSLNYLLELVVHSWSFEPQGSVCVSTASTGALDWDSTGLAGYHDNASRYLCKALHRGHNFKIVTSSDFCH